MTILILEHPRIPSETRFNDIANTPLWSCLLAGYSASGLIQAGHDVMLVDAQQKGWGFRDTKEEILTLSPDLLCINAVYFWEQTDRFFNFLNELRAENYTGHINLFGFFPTLVWKIILRQSRAVDSIAVGEPENILIELADRLRSGKDMKDIFGLAYKADKKIIFNGPRKPEKNPDLFPFPVRNIEPGETISILASRGCYNYCSFCPVPSFYNNGPLWRGRTPENIINEISLLYNQGGRDFYFIDPNFIGPGKRGRQRTFKLSEQIRKLGITYGIETRPNDLDHSILDQMLSSGLNSLLLGIESGSADILDGLGKHTSLNVSEKAIAACRSLGLEPEIGFLMFVPDSSIKDIESNFAFLKQNRLLDRLDRTVNLLSHYQIVLMGTPGYQYFENKGRLIKQGPLGFEGDIVYRSKRVAWLRDVIIETCRYIFKAMSEESSPIYWDRRNPTKKRKVNDFVEALFLEKLKDAKNLKNLPLVPDVTLDLRKEIKTMLE
ncbi:MAG TPA: B12-binding domain-containing radical SAM protein [Desulfobacteraceae bacterium]|nr:B12-binding domain-containing radical SAM protein [Desulfobacteraceae bacterium]